MSEYRLPDEALAEAAELNALEGNVWRRKAKYILDKKARANGTPTMLVLTACAYALRIGRSTASMYVGMEQAFGAVLDEVTPPGEELVSIGQLRRIYAAARKNKVSPDEELIRRINESDEWGGQVAPPDVIAAQTRNGRASDPPELAALKRGARCIASLARKTESKPDRLIYESWVRHLEKRIKESE